MVDIDKTTGNTKAVILFTYLLIIKVLQKVHDKQEQKRSETRWNFDGLPSTVITAAAVTLTFDPKI